MFAPSIRLVPASFFKAASGQLVYLSNTRPFTNSTTRMTMIMIPKKEKNLGQTTSTTTDEG